VGRQTQFQQNVKNRETDASESRRVYREGEGERGKQGGQYVCLLNSKKEPAQLGKNILAFGQTHMNEEKGGAPET